MADFNVPGPVEQLATLDDIERFVADGYWAASHGQRLPLAVAEPGPLIEHAVRLAGDSGMTLQEARRLFWRLGKERLDRGLAFARDAGWIEERRERRPNRAGRLQEQVVLYATREEED